MVSTSNITLTTQEPSNFVDPTMREQEYTLVRSKKKTKPILTRRDRSALPSKIRCTESRTRERGREKENLLVTIMNTGRRQKATEKPGPRQTLLEESPMDTTNDEPSEKSKLTTFHDASTI